MAVSIPFLRSCYLFKFLRICFIKFHVRSTDDIDILSDGVCVIHFRPYGNHIHIRRLRRKQSAFQSSMNSLYFRFFSEHFLIGFGTNIPKRAVFLNCQPGYWLLTASFPSVISAIIASFSIISYFTVATELLTAFTISK